MGYIKSKDCMVVWGKVSGHDARFHEFESGHCVTNFSVRYDSVPTDGASKGVYLDVKAWNDLAHYAACFEMGDSVLVAGRLTKDRKLDRNGNEHWYLDADICLAQPDLTPPDEEAPMMEEQDGAEPDVFADPGYGEGDFPEDLA